MRFPEFSEEWEEKNIGSVLSIGSGKDYKHLNVGNIPVYGTGGYMTSVNEYLYEGTSIGIGRKGTIDKPILLRGKFWTVDTLFYTHTFKNSTPNFLFSILQNINWKKYNEASGVPSLSKTTIEKIKIKIPHLPEQNKIAKFLTIIDNRIVSQSKIIEHQESLMKGLMQQIFSQQLRFKDECGSEYTDWKIKKLKDVCKKKSSNISANSLEANFGEYKIYGATGFLKNVNFYQEEDVYISIVKDGAGVGRTLLCDAKSSVLGTLDKIKPKNNNNLYFIFLVFKSLKIDKYITGSTIPHIYFKDYSNERIKLPCIEEQTKIANFFSSLDEKLEKEKQILAQYQQQKKYLLQNLFV